MDMETHISAIISGLVVVRVVRRERIVGIRLDLVRVWIWGDSHRGEHPVLDHDLGGGAELGGGA
jgi:hypothetical protein